MLAVDHLTVTNQEPPAMRRMALVDLEEMGSWLVARLMKRHPQATPAAILGWLRGCMASNDTWFVRTAHCCALATVARVPLEAQPVATEVFVLAQEGYEDEAETLYPRMASWAAHFDSSRLYVDRFTDVGRSFIRGQVGRLIAESGHYLNLGPNP